MGKVLTVGRYSLYILYILGLLLCVVGVIGGSIAIAEMMGYKSLFDEHPQVIAFLFGLLALTVILLISISFGGYATSIRHKWFIFGFAVAISIILGATIFMVITIMRKENVLARDISVAFSRVFFDDNIQDDRALIYKLQDHLQCCGVDSPYDWDKLNDTSITPGKDSCQNRKRGCVPFIEKRMKLYSRMLGYTASIFIGIEGLILIVATVVVFILFIYADIYDDDYDDDDSYEV